jgi:predicted pyridoxine 5'-phosphate oxidase superfamily flavin-nucleotide-binding protein
MGRGGPEKPGELYGEGARRLQDEHDSRRIADRLDAVTVHDGLTEADAALVARQSFFLLATVDADGWPDVSYKGGDPGFVRVIDPATLRFPHYDGNGMFRSLGNIADDGRVALLFVDLDRPWRMRVHGTATVSSDPALVDGFVGAQAVVTVTVGRVFPNCGRYIHDFAAGNPSPYVPHPGEVAPTPAWKQDPQLAPYLSGTSPPTDPGETGS